MLRYPKIKRTNTLNTLFNQIFSIPSKIKNKTSEMKRYNTENTWPFANGMIPNFR
jgi:hypothetical protein